MVRTTCALLMMAMSVTEASAQDAATLMEQGVDARRDGDDANALAFFRRAHALAPTARALAQIALAEQALGHWTDAAENLSEALADRGNWIEENQGVLTTALSVIREHVGQLELVGGEVGAEVFIDGELVGRLPLDTIWVAAGNHELQVHASGFAEFIRPLTIAAGGMAREMVVLRTESVGLQLDEALVAPIAPELRETTPIRKAWWLWTIVGLAAVGLGVGLRVGLDPGTQAPVTGDVGPGGVVVALQVEL